MLGDTVNTAMMYPLHRNSVLELSGVAGLGACYDWTQPCGVTSDPCSGDGAAAQSPTAAPGSVCPTATWFWITGAGILLIGLLKKNGGRRR